jgi:hypothetical protein
LNTAAAWDEIGIDAGDANRREGLLKVIADRAAVDAANRRHKAVFIMIRLPFYLEEREERGSRHEYPTGPLFILFLLVIWVGHV